MADIRKRTSAKGTTYQVRYATTTTKSGYAYATFPTLKEARVFRENGAERKRSRPSSEIHTVKLAADLWLKACEMEGLNGREPVSRYTLQNYEYRASFITAYDWPKATAELTAPDIVAFRSWLLKESPSRQLAGRVLSTLHSIMKEMVVRGYLSHNPVAGISIRADSRYRDPVLIPSKLEIIKLLQAADRLAKSKNKQTARTWRRYRPMLYLAVDTGMRPQEYLALSHASLRENGVFVDRAIEGSGTEISVTKTPAGRRFIEVSPDTLKMVRHYAEHHAVKNDYDLVFPTDNGSRQARRNWHQRGFNAACEEAGLVERVKVDGELRRRVKYSPYDLRHFFASMLIEKRTNLKKLQALMGHTSIETTLNVYGHLLEEADRQSEVPTGLLGGLLATNKTGVAGRNLPRQDNPIYARFALFAQSVYNQVKELSMSDTVPAAEFARNFGRYKLQAQREAVAVSSNGTLAGYFVAPHEYEELIRPKGMRRRFQTAGLRAGRIDRA